MKHLFLALLLLWASSVRAQEPLRITAVGDLRISRSSLGRGDHLKLAGDVVLANFEGVVHAPDADPWKLCVPSQAMESLQRMGIGVLNLANNHARDMGPAHYQASLAQLQRAGFAVVTGSGPGVRLQTAKGAVRIVGFSFCDANNVNRPERIAQTLGSKNGEVLVVTAHMGGENHLSHFIPRAMEFFGDEPRGDVVEFSHRCIEAGADLVLGHGPHVPRALELYQRKLIVYSLGNFLFDYPGAATNLHGAAYSISIDLDTRGDFVQARIDSYDLRGGVPVADQSQRAYTLIKNLTRHDFPHTELSFPGRGRVLTRR